MADTQSVSLTNTAAGPRGFESTAGHVMLDPGQSWSGDIANGELKSAEATGYFKKGKAGAAKVEKPEPTLADNTKAELLEIAATEGVDVDEGMTKAVIIELIEAKRAG
jgi:hypothetical protein